MIYKKDDIDMSLVSCDFEENSGYIYVTDSFTNDLLKLSGYSDISETDFYQLCSSAIFTEYMDEYKTKTPKAAIHYLYFVNSRCYDSEKVVATSAGFSYDYALDVLDGRFPLAEKTISASAEYSYKYARDVLKSRFKLGEESIASSAEYSYRYARDVLKSRFKLGEKCIATSSEYSYKYAMDVLKNRFKQAEDIISKHHYYNYMYRIDVLQKFK